MSLAPLLEHIEGQPTVVAVSGYSGAGTKKGDEPKITPESLGGAIRPYALTDHIHEREASRHLQTIGGNEQGVAFIPSVGPWFQGIIATVSVPLNKTLTAGNVRDLFQEKYAGEILVDIMPGVPEVTDISGQHGYKVGGFQVHSSGKRVVLVGALDNLLKGAATQCLQNLNIALGLDEYAGIPVKK